MSSRTKEISLDVLQSTNKKASEDAIGAVLLQAENWKLVAYESRSMTEKVCRYAQIKTGGLRLFF